MRYIYLSTYKNAFVPIIAVILLILITSIISLVTFFYFQDYTQNTQDLITTDSSLIPLQVQILSYNRNSALIQFPSNIDDIIITRVTLNGNNCNLAPLGQVTNRFVNINFTNCNESFSTIEPLLRIETTQYIIEQRLRIVDEFTTDLNATIIED